MACRNTARSRSRVDIELTANKALDDLRIVPVDRSDADSVADLYLASRAAMLPDLRRVHSDSTVRHWIATCLLPDTEVWLAKLGQEGTVAGMLALDGNFVDQLYLAPAWFRHGIGTRLIAHAKALRPEGLSLYCFKRNEAARHFYERQGFRLALERDGRSNEEEEPDCLYLWP